MDDTDSSAGFWGYIGGGRYDHSVRPQEVWETVRLRGMFSFLAPDEHCPINCQICEKKKEGR